MRQYLEQLVPSYSALAVPATALLPLSITPSDSDARQLISCQQALDLRDFRVLLSSQSDVRIGWGIGLTKGYIL